MFNKIVPILLVLVIIVVFYFSWLPDPRFTHETYLPHWLLDWSNKYYNLQTAVPFIAFGYLQSAYSQHKNANNTNVNRNLIFIQNLGIAAIVAFIAECGQLLIKNRNPDLMDIYYGTIGSLIGATIYNLYIKIRLRSEK